MDPMVIATDVSLHHKDRAGSDAPAVFDMLLVTACLIILMPVMALASLAVLLESGRPIIFTQIRLGRNGKPFRLYKFRKFHERDAGGGGALTLENDPRLSKVGWILERTKLDELPQLWNVLKGEMSLVGPRPESLHFADCFTEYSCLLDYRPGIFGPTQTIFRNEGALHRVTVDPDTFYRNVLFPAKARIDLAYYPIRTVTRDLGWMAQSVLAVIGLARIPQIDRNTVQEIEDWIRGYPAFRSADVQRRNMAPGE
jgi:lipopolysaccharide/colanic/teichoic acid biosynthesis glycosyltransferase